MPGESGGLQVIGVLTDRNPAPGGPGAEFGTKVFHGDDEPRILITPIPACEHRQILLAAHVSRASSTATSEPTAVGVPDCRSVALFCGAASAQGQAAFFRQLRIRWPGRCCSPCWAPGMTRAPVRIGVIHCRIRSRCWVWATSAGVVPAGASRCDRLRRPLTRRPLTRDRRLRGNGQEWTSGPLLTRVRIN
jgi:hypothetical protein